jgi:glycosyltransferase involved in cell wall biosynthesis
MLSISFIVTYYKKSAPILEECLNSIVTNMDDGDEMILVDDNSKDGVCKQVQSSFKSLKVSVLHENMGPGEARNIGLQLAHGDLIQFVDGDDILAPGRSSLLRPYLIKHPELPFVSSAYHTFADSVSLSNKTPYPNKLYEKTPTKDIPYLPCLGLYRASYLKELGPFKNYRRWMDLEFHSRIIRTTPYAFHLGEPLYGYRVDVPNQISSIQIDRSHQAFLSFQDAYHNLPRATAKEWLYPLSATLARQSQWLKPSGKKWKAMIFAAILAPDIFRKSKWLAYALITFPLHRER